MITGEGLKTLDACARALEMDEIEPTVASFEAGAAAAAPAAA